MAKKSKDKRKGSRGEQRKASKASQPSVNSVLASAAFGVAVKPPSAIRAGAAKNGTALGRVAAGGRLTRDSNSAFFGNLSYVMPPQHAEDTWRYRQLDTKMLDRVPLSRLFELLCDLSPEISKGAWDFERMVNPGYELHAYSDAECKNIDKKGEQALGDFTNTLKEYYGSFDIQLNRMSLCAYIRGAILAELVLGENADIPADFVTPDPVSVRFRAEVDPIRGQIYIPGQYQNGVFVKFDRPTIRYIPVDPFPSSPYGRSMIAPAIFSALFLLGILHDLKRVVQQQGYPRIDISIDMNKLKELMPENIQGDSEEIEKWVTAAMTQIQAFYDKLEPDDAYLHGDMITVNKAVGTVDSNSLKAIDDLIKALERMLTRALKSMPLLMATTDGASEANANRQWEIYVAGIKSIQHSIEAIVERLMSLALQAQGIKAYVKFRFAELRAAELLRDAQVEVLNANIAAAHVMNGWIDNNEAANRIVGHDAVAEAPLSMTIPTGGAGNPANVQAEPGSNRNVYIVTPRGVVRLKRQVIRVTGKREVETVTPTGEQYALPIPPVIEVDDETVRAQLAEWESQMGDITVDSLSVKDLLNSVVVEV